MVETIRFRSASVSTSVVQFEISMTLPLAVNARLGRATFARSLSSSTTIGSWSQSSSTERTAVVEVVSGPGKDEPSFLNTPIFHVYWCLNMVPSSSSGCYPHPCLFPDPIFPTLLDLNTTDSSILLALFRRRQHSTEVNWTCKKV